jgi:hypothetical protein
MPAANLHGAGRGCAGRSCVLDRAHEAVHDSKIVVQHFAIEAGQFVVQLAFEMMKCLLAS